MLGRATDFRFDLVMGGYPDSFVRLVWLFVVQLVLRAVVLTVPPVLVQLYAKQKKKRPWFSLFAPFGVTKADFRGRSTTKAFVFSVLSVLFEWLVTFVYLVDLVLPTLKRSRV